MAERVRAKINSPDQPLNPTTDAAVIVNLYPAARKLYEIIFAFEAGYKTHEEAVARRRDLEEWGLMLTRRMSSYLDEPVKTVTIYTEKGGTREVEVGRGYLVRQKAVEDARKVVVERRAKLDALKKESSEKPRGEKLHLRRVKAQARRGAKLRDIH